MVKKIYIIDFFKFSRVVIWNKEVLISPALLTNILILSNSVTIFFATFLVSSSLEKLKNKEIDYLDVHFLIF